MDFTVQIITISKFLGVEFENSVELILCHKGSEDALSIAEEKKPLVILLEYELEKLNTGLYIKSLLAGSHNSKVIFFGKDLSDEIILDCLSYGAYGYLENRDMDRFLLKAIYAVAKGQAWVTRRLIGLLIERIRG